MTSSVSTIISDIVTALAEDGWTPRWPACLNAVGDEYGNSVAFHDRGETVLVEFEYALGGIVETMHLNPHHGGTRIAAVISTLAAAPRD